MYNENKILFDAIVELSSRQKTMNKVLNKVAKSTRANSTSLVLFGISSLTLTGIIYIQDKQIRSLNKRLEKLELEE